MAPHNYEAALADALALWRETADLGVVVERHGGNADWWRLIFRLTGDHPDEVRIGRLSLAEARAAHFSGSTVVDIAEQAGVSRQAVYDALTRLPNPLWVSDASEMRADLLADYNAGLTLRTLAWKYGYSSIDSVKSVLKRIKKEK